MAAPTIKWGPRTPGDEVPTILMFLDRGEDVRRHFKWYICIFVIVGVTFVVRYAAYWALRYRWVLIEIYKDGRHAQQPAAFVTQHGEAQHHHMSRLPSTT